ncbi:hypothetical protein RB195_000391 [Necator americanus]|uniref:mitogen-activated protein kinase n=2 Tax=Necator americanus TaxID=51031 RepID=A0ABR1D9G6_NECAM
MLALKPQLDYGLTKSIPLSDVRKSRAVLDVAFDSDFCPVILSLKSQKAVFATLGMSCGDRLIISFKLSREYSQIWTEKGLLYRYRLFWKEMVNKIVRSIFGFVEPLKSWRRPTAEAFLHIVYVTLERPPPVGFHEIELNKTRWVIPKTYDRLRSLGEGAYGVVCTAEDLRTKERVAVKKFLRPFQSTIHAKRTYRELKLLRTLKHSNVLEMIDVFTPDSDAASLNSVYFVSVLMGSDLQNILKIQRLTNDQIQSLIYQVLRGLKYIHSAGIVHRDLKPSNIAVNEIGEVKILDFGLARAADHEMTGYVATRWYRAPEIMLNWMHYTQTVDVWSVGCILAELVSGKPMFPGDDHIDQLTRIMGVVGTPSCDFLSKIQSEEARNYIRNLPWMPRVDFFTLLPDASAEAVDLLGRMLALDPDDRIPVTEALEHPYVQDCRYPEGEPVADHIVGMDSDEETATTLDDWRCLIWKEIQMFRDSCRQNSSLGDFCESDFNESEEQTELNDGNKKCEPAEKDSVMEGELREVKPGYYTVELNRTVWAVPVYYQNLTPIGTGAYGTVCAAECLRTNTRVAIKKFSRPFQSVIHARRTFRELRLLRNMDHENVIDMLDVFTPDACCEQLTDVYFVSMLMGADLSNILKIQRLNDEHIQFLVYQILRGLKYIHSAGIIHRDLKPSNIAVNEDCELKILDFGLARQTDNEMTGYVATRWYRAPEIMLNWMHYTQTVDIWSVGCILAELITGRTLFPGSDHIDQLTRIMNVVGTPNEEFLTKIQSEEARNYIRNIPRMPRKDFRRLFPTASPAAVDLLEKMLQLDPDYRPTAAEAMEHEYLAAYHDETDEPVAEELELDEGVETNNIDEWRRLIWDEIEDFSIHQSPSAENATSMDE